MPFDIKFKFAVALTPVGGASWRVFGSAVISFTRSDVNIAGAFRFSTFDAPNNAVIYEWVHA